MMESSLPLACDFRRLRFSRNARFSRSCRGSLAGFFAGALASPSFSSVIVDLRHDRKNAPIGDLLARLLSEHIVFHSPLVQAPIPGIPATPLVPTSVVRIFGNFRRHRRFVGCSHDVALEFAANIGKCRRSAKKWGTGSSRSGPSRRRPRPLHADFGAFCGMAGRSARLR
jgi:hypothetical protein